MNTRLVVFAVSAIGLLAGPALAEDLSFTLTNSTDYDVVGFYVSPAGVDAWEDNLLDGHYLAGGYEVDVLIADGRDVCTYDIRVEFEDGDSMDDYGIDICDLGGYTVE